jgi:hypothetical protein
MLLNKVRELAAGKSFPMQVNGKPWVYCSSHGTNEALHVHVSGLGFDVCRGCFYEICPEVQDAKRVEAAQLSLPAVTSTTTKLKCDKRGCSEFVDRTQNCCTCRRPFCDKHLVSGIVCEDCSDDNEGLVH